MKNITLFFLSWIIFPSLTMANELSPQEAESYAKNHLLKSQEKHIIVSQEMLLQQTVTIAYLYHLSPQGFILVSTQKTRNPIIGFSWENNFELPQNPYDNAIFPLLEGIHRGRKALNNNPELDKPSKSKSFVVGPYVYTRWGQVNCHNASGSIINVTNLNTPNNCAVGCVAISLASILDYYEWPPRGKGSHSYYDGSGSLTGNHEANYAYDIPWELMKDQFNNQKSTEEERAAVGLLTYQSAVGVNMNFENGGSTSNVNNIPYALSHFFRIRSYYKNINSSGFWVLVDKNMIEANPVAIAIENNAGSGHSMIIDGLMVEDDGDRFYHINCGWWGTTNGWYACQDSFNAGTYTTILGGVVNTIPIPYIPQQSYYGTNIITLNWSYTNALEPNSFKVQQKINSGSWITIEEEATDTSLLIALDDTLQDYYYRVKAKINGEYYTNSWSNTMQLLHTTVGINNSLIADFQVFPNPATNMVQLSNITNFQEIEVFDILGQYQYTQKLKPNTDQLSLDISSWEKGIYILRMKNEKIEQIHRFVKN
jgi:hypothetical protein